MINFQRYTVDARSLRLGTPHPTFFKRPWPGTGEPGKINLHLGITRPIR